MVFSKNSRFGKRPSNSSSSYLFTVTMVVILAFCLLGVWMLTASSVITPQTQKQTFSAASRIEAKDPDLMDDAEHIPDNYHSTSSSSSLKPDEDLGRRALRPPIEQEEERQVEQQREIESDDDAERSESGRGGSAVGGDMETTTGDGDEKQLEIEDKPRKEDQQDNFKDDENQQPTDEGEEREAVTQEDQEKGSEQGATEGDKVEEKAEDIVEVENQLQSQIEEAQEKQQPETDESVENGQHQIEETVENQQPQTDDNAVIQQLETEESVENQQSPREESGENQKSETEENVKELNSNESFPDGAQSEISRETNFEQGSWATQADQSENEKERQVASVPEEKVNNETYRSVEDQDGANYGYRWDLCNVTSGPDYIPCLDNEKALKQLHSTKHFEHRERHCPDESPTCLVPLPKGYKPSVGWPKSRDKIWYNNVPNTKLAAVKGHQNWVKATGEYLTFPGGGTQFIHGALHYIDFIQQVKTENF